MNQPYRAKNIFGLCLADVISLHEILQFFDKYPELKTLEVEGESFQDDGDLCHTVIDLKVNGISYEWGEPINLSWVDGDAQQGIEDHSITLLMLVSQGEEMEEIEANITRYELDALRPYLEIAIQLYNMTTLDKIQP